MTKLAFDYTRVKERMPHNRSHEEGRESLMSGNKWLFLGPFQEIGKGWTPERLRDPRIEWDHIFPRVRADRFLKESYQTKTGRKQWARSKAHQWTHRIGNFAGIDSSANRGLSDRSIHDKMAYNKKSAKGRARTYMDPDYIHTNPVLDRRSFELLFRLHEQEEAVEREEGGRVFSKFAKRRGRDIWDTVTALVGGPMDRKRAEKLMAPEPAGE
jgi:hypothetical protein